jgi:hypothetical protein
MTATKYKFRLPLKTKKIKQENFKVKYYNLALIKLQYYIELTPKVKFNT